MSQAHKPLDYAVDVSTAIEPFLERWAALAGADASPFHALPWVRAWYATLGSQLHYEPLLVGVRRADTGADVMLLALTRWQRGGLSFVGFADATVVDYTSPLVAADWAGGIDPDNTAVLSERARRLWSALRQALRGHDVLRIDKMLVTPLDESLPRINPLALALRPKLQDCEMFGNQFHVAEDWDAWRHSLPKRVRKEFERSWRVFTRSEHARFERVTEPDAAMALFAQLERQQAARMDQLDYTYVLDAPAFRAFYRQALAGGLADGSVVLTALRDGDEVVSAQFGVANAHRYVALRLSSGGDAWKTCSPGRLLCEQTAGHLHAQGLHWFDFGIGDYRHKQMFEVSHIPLLDGCEALSWRGLPAVWAWRVRRTLKRQRWLIALWRRLQQKPAQEA